MLCCRPKPTTPHFDPGKVGTSIPPPNIPDDPTNNKIFTSARLPYQLQKIIVAKQRSSNRAWQLGTPAFSRETRYAWRANGIHAVLLNPDEVLPFVQALQKGGTAPTQSATLLDRISMNRHGMGTILDYPTALVEGAPLQSGVMNLDLTMPPWQPHGEQIALFPGTRPTMLAQWSPVDQTITLRLGLRHNIPGHFTDVYADWNKDARGVWPKPLAATLPIPRQQQTLAIGLWWPWQEIVSSVKQSEDEKDAPDVEIQYLPYDKPAEFGNALLSRQLPAGEAKLVLLLTFE